MVGQRTLFFTSVTSFALFAPLAWWVRRHKYLSTDIAITRKTQKKQTSLLRTVIRIGNVGLCSDASLSFLVMPVGLFLWKKRMRLEATLTIVLCWASLLIRASIKRLIDRPRPSLLLINTRHQSSGKSFPSGDVAAGVGVWGWLYMLGRFHKSQTLPKQKRLLRIPLYLIALVGPARVYLGDHWTTDVLGGYLFGLGWLSLALQCYLWLKKQSAWTSHPH